MYSSNSKAILNFYSFFYWICWKVSSTAEYAFLPSHSPLSLKRLTFELYTKSLLFLNLLAAPSLPTTKCCPYLYILWTAFVLPFYFLIVSLIHLNYLTRGRYWRVWSKKTSWFVFIFIRHVFVENLPSSRHYSKAVGKIILPTCSLPSFGRRQTINTDTNKTGKGIGCASGM